MAAKVSATKVAIKYTSQANDDLHAAEEGSISYIDVLGNDLGGAAISLYSLYAGTVGESMPAGDILALGSVQEITTASGAVVRISTTESGQLEYDTTGFEDLPAGETFQDTF